MLLETRESRRVIIERPNTETPRGWLAATGAFCLRLAARVFQGLVGLGVTRGHSMLCPCEAAPRGWA
jgi:hypothetical protein